MICVSGGSEHNNESHHHFKRIDSVHKIQVQIQNTLLIPRGNCLNYMLELLLKLLNTFIGFSYKTL